MSKKASTPRQAGFDDKIAQLIQTDRTMLVPLSIYPHLTDIDGKLKLVGHYIATRKGTPLSFDPENVIHYIGVHECLCLTIRRPPFLEDMLTQTQCLGEVPPFGQVVWLGGFKAQPKSLKNRTRRMYIPMTLWKPPRQLRGRRLWAHGIVHPVKGTGQCSRFEYWVMDLPVFHRDQVLERYILDE
jgi:hypothetical protein